MHSSPFKFLDSYTRDDRHIFFGRDREIEELYQRVFESKLLLVYGISGTGKSSLIHCGLANKFRETDWLPLVIRRGGNMIESMASGIKAASLTEQQSKFVGPSDFKKAVKSLYLDHYKPVFFIFDQFEELFIFGDKEERKNFVQIVKSLIESDLQCRLIFVMREEYMAGITEFERFIPTFFANRVRIEKMSHVNALEAINEPCKVFNIALEDGFADALLERLSPGSTDVELTYLQVFLDKIFRLAVNEKPSEKKQQQLSFTLSLLDKIGNVSDLLGSFLDDQISLMEQPDIALLILKSLVSVQGTKRSMTAEEIAESTMTFGRTLDNHVIVEMLQTFINLRILRDRDENDKVELRHDALAVKIFEKFTIVEKELLEVRKFVENGFYTFEKRGLLLSKQDLEYLASYDNKLVLPQDLNDFVIQSKYKIESRKKSLVRITRISALIFVLMIAAFGRYYLRTQQTSETDRLIGSSVLKSEVNPGKGIFTVLKLWEKDTASVLLQFIILNDFQKLLLIKADSSNPVSLLQKELEPYKLESRVLMAEQSKTGKFIYGFMENKRVFVWNIPGKEVLYFSANGIVEHIEFSEKDSALALVYNNNSGEVRDFYGKILYRFETTLNGLMNERLVRFFPSGDCRLLVAKDNQANIYNSSGKIVFELKAHSAKVNSVDVSPDGRFMATASSDKKTFIWNFNQLTNQMSVYDSLVGHRDTVWSCEFNSTGKYVLTASADSMIKIWTLSGKQINPVFMFGKNYEGIYPPGAGARYRTNNGEYDSDVTIPELSVYYRKFCNASFSESGKEIVATGYKIEKYSSGHQNLIYNQVPFYDSNSKLIWTNIKDFVYLLIDPDYSCIPETYQQIVISPSALKVAVVNNESEIIKILNAGGVRMINIEGHFPMFSKDGNVLFWINKNEINKIPVSPEQVKILLEKCKVSESSFINRDELLVL